MSTAVTEFSEGLRRVGFLEPLIREVEKLSKQDKETLAWQLMDRVSLVVVLALRASDDKALALRDNSFATENLSFHDNAPIWARQWPGPFWVEVAQSIRDYFAAVAA